MPRKKVKQIEGAELRHRAEEWLEENIGAASSCETEGDPLKLLHELQVHRIELEMQNEELRRSRSEMAELLETYSDLYDFAPVAYYTLDHKGIIRAANLTAAALLGIERSRLIGRHFASFVPDDSRSVFSGFLAKVFSSPARESCELPLLKNGNGSLFVLIEAVAAASGEECRIAVIDICDRIGMEELLQTEGRYRSVVEDLTEIITRVNPGGAFTFVNDACCRLSGKTRDELLGSTWRSNVFPDDVQSSEEQLSRLAPSNPVVTIESRILTASGEVIWMQSVNRGVFDKDGRLTEIQSVSRNINELKEAENALRTADERLKMALTATKMGVWDWNVQTNDLFWSPEVYEIFGVESSSLALETFTNALHPDDAGRVMAAARQALAEKKAFDMEFRIIHSDGLERWVSDSALPVYDEHGRPLRLTGTVQDITERKRREGEIIQLNADLAAQTAALEKSNRDLAAFNYMAAHDLRQPLNTVYISAQALELLCLDRIGEECMNFLQIIKNRARNMGDLLGTFLRFSQAEHAELHKKIGDLSEIARIVSADLRMADSGRKVTFRIENGVTVYGDVELLRVVMANLLGNAWKYTGNMEQAIIEFGTMEMDGRKSFFVRDNGRGFDMSEAEKLFVPFERLTGTEEFTGHGIGLATVERIIRRHGGKIWAIGEPGKGATFFFTLGE